jgi:hydroxypyruvate reductase
METQELREAAKLIAHAAIESVDPKLLTHQSIALEGEILTIAGTSVDLKDFREILVFGAGKAGAAMASAVEDILGDKITGGVVVVKDGHGRPLKRVAALEASHPVPDLRGVKAAESIISLLEARAAPNTLMLCLISGGGSALMPLPAAPITLADKQEITNLLLRCGASINELNAVRKHVSRIKGGRLARAAFPSRLFTLILSDVVGDHLDVIASGPTVGDPSTFFDCKQILQSYKIWHDTPESVRHLIERGIDGDIDETPKPGDKIFDPVSNVIIGNNNRALKAASAMAESLGFSTNTLSSHMTGEAREVGTMLASLALEVRHSGNPLSPPKCILAGGETTVTVRGAGKGGRNQELALSAALKLSLSTGIVIAGVGTDGTDGPTDAAGAIVDTATVERARNQGLDPLEYLNRNDSYNLLNSTGDLLVTGPTGTNVMDLMIALIG